MRIDRWLERAMLLSVGVNILLGVWLYAVSRNTQDVEQKTREYATARTVYDTTKVVRERAVRQLREARQVLVITDTVQVKEYIAITDSVIVADSVALAAADAALAKADSLIRELRGKKPRLIQPFAEILYSPYSRQYVGRLGVDVRAIRNLSVVVAAEARASGPGVFLGARVTF